MRDVERSSNLHPNPWRARLRAMAATVLFLLWLPAARAQDADDEQPLQGENIQQYNVKQSVEFGGRFTSISGSQSVYDTFVNLQQGPRLLGFTTEMRSLDNHGSLFDRLYINSFGYGGDPNDVTRLRVSKNKWYDFDVIARRDENIWDYSLMANPLNPTTPFANAPPTAFAPVGPLGFAAPTCTGCVLTNSPHLFNTRRHLTDYNLLLLPQSRVRFRIGYSRNINEGPAMTTYHEGTEQLLDEDVKTTVNTYRLGVDFRVLPRTNISYDEIWNDYKGDTGATDQNQLFALSTGQLVDLGVSFNSTASQPCANTFAGGPPPATPVVGAVSPTCSAFLSYLLHGRVRTGTPTEQISMQSNYWKNVDISGRFSYTAGDADEFNFLENQVGLARGNQFGTFTTGGVHGERVAASGDLGVTWHITNQFSFLDAFHYSNFHNPLQFDYSDCSFFSPNLITTPNAFNTATLTTPLPVPCVPETATNAGNPVHTTSSAPDLAIDRDGGFLKQEEESNLAEVDYQVSSKLGARVGFRYRHREIDYNSFADNEEFYFPTDANRGDCALAGTPPALPAGCTSIGGGAFEFVTPVVTYSPGEVEINEYSGLFGIWARPVQNWRISFDTELMSADNVFTRISPRQSQEYRVRSVYKPVSWVNISGSVRIWEGRDNVYQIDNLQHDRSYGFSTLFQPNSKWAIDLSYDYNDVFSQILICYPSTPAPAGVNKCPTSTGLVEQLSVYQNHSNYGGFDLMWKPVPHLTTHLGGSFTGTSGSLSALNGMPLILNANQPNASLDSKWLSPTGGLDYAFTKNWMGKAYWNYYGYHEDPTFVQGVLVPQDMYAPRNFRGNTVTLSARYAF